jgi:hypothetical protein
MDHHYGPGLFHKDRAHNVIGPPPNYLKMRARDVTIGKAWENQGAPAEGLARRRVAVTVFTSKRRTFLLKGPAITLPNLELGPVQPSRHSPLVILGDALD